MYCTRCGERVDEKDNFCKQCGCCLLTKEIQQKRDALFVDEKKEDHPGHCIKKISKKWLVVVAAVLLCLIAVILVYCNIPNSSARLILKVEEFLVDDLGYSPTITAIYYREESQRFLVEFVSGYSKDIASVNLKERKISYYSTYENYKNMFNSANDDKDKQKWARKMVEYDEIAIYILELEMSMATGNGVWIKIK